MRTPLAIIAAAGLLVGSAPLGVAPWAAGQQAPIDPALTQHVDAAEHVAPPGELTTIDSGHVDLGPMLAPSKGLFARDDTATSPVWRHLDDVVFYVSNAAAQQLPAGDEFAFVGAAPGETVWVVPQTEVAGVPWLGWNTQSPSLLNAADQGVTFEFAGHQGPGDFSLFLQNGGFEPPQVLWLSSADSTQTFWAQLNTHTHANWVFTEPGIHKVALTITAPLNDGTEFTDTQILTFAVGENTDPAAAHFTEWEGALPETAAAEETSSKSGAGTVVFFAVAGLLLAVVIGGPLVALRQKAARR
ncbi:choice-of-anchor M domain-containing protein [Corynebacterium mayonis]|uniref:choice-of-anchor M domain-containing protein n=1 Tax=Corynebacterium mayonis TaxID=3062461 RepID=UPI00313FFFD5